VADRPVKIDILSVNIGVPKPIGEIHGSKVYSGIEKEAVRSGTVLWLSLANLSGDGQADLSVHGGPDKAVYAYPSEHLPRWEADLDETFGPAPFGENLSTSGATEDTVCIGDRWAWDGAVLEVCQPRWPCFKLTIHRRRADVGSRMRSTARTGWYLRVLQPGEVTVGSPIEVIERDPAGLSVKQAHLAMSDRHLDDRALVEALAHHPRLAAQWQDPLADRLIDT
jgi:MOSC domain-containing protein YiiM